MMIVYLTEKELTRSPVGLASDAKPKSPNIGLADQDHQSMFPEWGFPFFYNFALMPCSDLVISALIFC
jgi:hypothetical protein